MGDGAGFKATTVNTEKQTHETSTARMAEARDDQGLWRLSESSRFSAASPGFRCGKRNFPGNCCNLDEASPDHYPDPDEAAARWRSPSGGGRGLREGEGAEPGPPDAHEISFSPAFLFPSVFVGADFPK